MGRRCLDCMGETEGCTLRCYLCAPGVLLERSEPPRLNRKVRIRIPVEVWSDGSWSASGEGLPVPGAGEPDASWSVTVEAWVSLERPEAPTVEGQEVTRGE